MELSVLKLFVLSMLQRGCQTPYDLQRSAGLSQGSSLPVLRALSDTKFVKRREGLTNSKRPKHEYTPTDAGNHSLRSGWKRALQRPQADYDVDSVLRLVDLALHYGGDKNQVRKLLQSAADHRILQARKTELEVQGFQTNQGPVPYPQMRLLTEAARLRFY
jgi:DNA-binding PadR family transcriptional regulator